VGTSISGELAGCRGRKVIGPPSLLHATCSSTDFSLLTRIALTAKLEATKKALAEERDVRQVANQALQASQEAGAALTQEVVL
jgi:hypothetical protein